MCTSATFVEAELISSLLQILYPHVLPGVLISFGHAEHDWTRRSCLDGSVYIGWTNKVLEQFCRLHREIISVSLDVKSWGSGAQYTQSMPRKLLEK